MADFPELTIKCTDLEATQTGAVEFRFKVHNGFLTIHEKWDSKDEIWGDGHAITLPPRVWSEALGWLQQHIPAKSAA